MTGRDAELLEQAETRECLCETCGNEYAVWFAPNALWNRVVRDHVSGDHEPFLCPTCFTNLAEERGVKPTAWMVAEEDISLSSALIERDKLAGRLRLALAVVEAREIALEEVRAYARALVNGPPDPLRKSISERLLNLAAFEGSLPATEEGTHDG